MVPSKLALACAASAAGLAATVVAGQRVGLALALALLLAIAAGMLGAQRSPARGILALALALAVQPLLRDAGWVVAVDVSAALVASLVAAGRLEAWAGVRRSLLAPWTLITGLARAAGRGRALGPVTPNGRLWAVLRGAGLAWLERSAALAVLACSLGGLTVALAFADVEQASQMLAVAYGASFLVLGLLARTRTPQP